MIFEANGPVFSSGHDMKEMMVITEGSQVMAWAGAVFVLTSERSFFQTVFFQTVCLVDEKGRKTRGNPGTFHNMQVQLSMFQAYDHVLYKNDL